MKKTLIVGMIVTALLFAFLAGCTSDAAGEAAKPNVAQCTKTTNCDCVKNCQVFTDLQNQVNILSDQVKESQVSIANIESNINLNIIPNLDNADNVAPADNVNVPAKNI